jgi:LmbE family N-acetylglucosaminyl deacetylase
MTQPRLLGIFAHPDDESFGSGGMLAKYAREGVEVHICIVTDGAAGSYVPDPTRPDAPASLAELRRGELECAVQALGAQLHCLNYRDSGMEGTADNHYPDSLYQAELDDVARDILALVCEIRPHVIVTHDPTGGYFHPDHIRVNHAVSLAWQALENPAAYPGLLPDGCTWRPARLYYGVIPRSALRWLITLSRLMGRDPRKFGRNQDIDMTQVGMPDEQIQVRIDVAPYAAVKEAAGACHRSQGGGAGPQRMPGFLRRFIQRYEHYQQAYPPGAPRHTDLFDGVEVE